MQITKIYCDANRYFFDRILSPETGWIILRTKNDSKFFGNWINISTFTFVNYWDGYVTYTQCENKREFKTELKRTLNFYCKKNKCPKIDCSGYRKLLREWKHLRQFDIVTIKDILV